MVVFLTIEAFFGKFQGFETKIILFLYLGVKTKITLNLFFVKKRRIRKQMFRRYCCGNKKIQNNVGLVQR